MLLRECIDGSSGRTFRDYADAVGCSHNHLVQVAHLQKSLSLPLARKLKAFDARFSYEDQHDAYLDAARSRATKGAAA